jgi:hypothetical protein
MKMEHINFARQNIDLTIFVVRESESVRWVSEISDIIFRIGVVKGSLFLKTPYPLSPILAMEVDSSFGYPMMNLIPLV